MSDWQDTSDSYSNHPVIWLTSGYSLSSHSGLLERLEDDQSWVNYSALNPLVIAVSGTQATGSRVANVVKEVASSFFSLGDQLAFVQSELSLRTSELSKVLGVSRPTIYAWMRSEGTPRKENLTRISTLTVFAEYWSNRSPVPLGARVRQPVAEYGRLIDLLGQDEIDFDVVERILDHFAQISGEKIEDEAKPSAEELARKYGIKNYQSKHENAEVSLLSGKRVSSE